MILKNTYGLSTILSDRSIRQRTTVNNFAGSSLNRNRKLDTASLRVMYEEICDRNEEANFQSQMSLLRIVGARIFQREAKAREPNTRLSRPLSKEIGRASTRRAKILKFARRWLCVDV